VIASEAGGETHRPLPREQYSTIGNKEIDVEEEMKS